MICEHTGKQCHSKSDAQRALRVLQTDRWSDHPELLNIYRCRWCGRWHVGHQGHPIPRNPNS